jgi:hypothetical protein
VVDAREQPGLAKEARSMGEHGELERHKRGVGEPRAAGTIHSAIGTPAGVALDAPGADDVPGPE